MIEIDEKYPDEGDKNEYSEKRLERLKAQANESYRFMKDSIGEVGKLVEQINSVAETFTTMSKGYVKILHEVESELTKPRF